MTLEGGESGQQAYGKNSSLLLSYARELFDWGDIIWVLKSLSDGCVSKLYGGGGGVLVLPGGGGLNDKH